MSKQNNDKPTELPNINLSKHPNYQPILLKFKGPELGDPNNRKALFSAVIIVQVEDVITTSSIMQYLSRLCFRILLQIIDDVGRTI